MIFFPMQILLRLFCSHPPGSNLSHHHPLPLICKNVKFKDHFSRMFFTLCYSQVTFGELLFPFTELLTRSPSTLISLRLCLDRGPTVLLLALNLRSLTLGSGAQGHTKGGVLATVLPPLRQLLRASVGKCKQA